VDRIGTALVTGASRGIGEAFARQLAAQGKDLVLVARDEARLRGLAAELSAAHHVRVHVIAADLSLPDAAGQVFAETERLGIEVDLLVNNAGVGKRGEFAALGHDLQAAMLRLNVNTPVELARLYLPGMRARRHGGMINVASNAAFQPVPTMAVYAASKAFLLHFSEAVAEEVGADGIRVMALCPGATDTAFWDVAGVWENSRWWMTPPEKVVAQGLRAFARGRAFFVPGLGYMLAAFGARRLGPRWLVRRIAGRVLRNR
jgi:short-subunit dehydrogenase